MRVDTAASATISAASMKRSLCKNILNTTPNSSASRRTSINCNLGGNAGLEVFVFGRYAGEKAAEYALNAQFCEPETNFSYQPEPAGFFEAAAELLDRYIHPLSTADDFAAGAAEALPEHPRKRFLQLIF